MCKLKMPGWDQTKMAEIFPVKPRFLHDNSIYLIEIWYGMNCVGNY